MHLGVGVEQVPLFDIAEKKVTAEPQTTVGVCVWRSDLTKALIWVHTRCTWVCVFHMVAEP